MRALDKAHRVTHNQNLPISDIPRSDPDRRYINEPGNCSSNRRWDTFEDQKGDSGLLESEGGRDEGFGGG